MITPDEIRQKAKRQYSKFRKAWLKGETFFPYMLPASKKTDSDLAKTIHLIQQLRKESKQEKGFGYSVEWVERRDRTHGLNDFPDRIFIETEDDLLRLIGKKKEFTQFAAAVEKVRQRYPKLIDWIQSHPAKFQDVTAIIDELLQVVDYFRDNPRPNLFIRELPLKLNTKFIGANKAILTNWFDCLLPQESINNDETQFERRYGLKYAQQHYFIRFLDVQVQNLFGSPWEECSVPIQSLSEIEVAVKNVIIVENKVNLLTLPPLKETLALGGLGNSVTDLRMIPWLHDSSIWYWGDIDVDGLLILSRFRSFFPQTVSLMMDQKSINRWSNSIGQTVPDRKLKSPSLLTVEESKAFEYCMNNHLRIEQEQIPQTDVIEVLESIF